MRVIDRKRKRKWYQLFSIEPISGTWGLDSFKITGNTSDIEVALVSSANKPPEMKSSLDANGFYWSGGEFFERKKFSSTGNGQHDFTFSSNNIKFDVVISGLNSDNEITEIICNTNFGLFQGVDLVYPNGVVFPQKAVFQNQEFSAPSFFLNIYTGSGYFLKTTYLDISYAKHCGEDDIDALLSSLNASGNENGTFIYTGAYFGSQGESIPTNRSAYDSLIAKGWTITGTPPPTN